MNRPARPSAWMTALLLTFALALSGWAHRPMGRAELLAFAGPDGSLPVLCIAGGDQQPEGAAGKPCPACTLVASVLPDAATDLPGRTDQTALAVWPLADEPSAPPNAPPAPPARGPPPSVSV